MQTTVTAQWLHDNLNNPNLILLDASLPSKADGSNSDYASQTIANARQFDLKNVFKEVDGAFPNTAPTPEHFEAECQKLGINQDSHIVVFDNFGVYSSPRAWWLFQLMGHNKVAVLDGGLPEWIEQGFEAVSSSLNQTKDIQQGNFIAQYQPELLIDFKTVKDNIQSKDFTIIDARSAGRFDGTAKELRQHLQSGYIAHSLNLPYQTVLDGHKLKAESELKQIFISLLGDNHSTNPAQKSEQASLVFSCGSGMTACIILLAYETIVNASVDTSDFISSKKVYDGSWTEWAELNGLRVLT